MRGIKLNDHERMEQNKDDNSIKRSPLYETYEIRKALSAIQLAKLVLRTKSNIETALDICYKARTTRRNAYEFRLSNQETRDDAIWLRIVAQHIKYTSKYHRNSVFRKRYFE